MAPPAAAPEGPCGARTPLLVPPEGSSTRQDGVLRSAARSMAGVSLPHLRRLGYELSDLGGVFRRVANGAGDDPGVRLATIAVGLR